jgi:N-acetylneuraminic acid mutarotase
MRVTKYHPNNNVNQISVSNDLILNVDAAQNNQLANRISVNNLFTNKILKTGDTLTTPSIQSTAPTQDKHSIRKIDVTNRVTAVNSDPNNLTQSQIDGLLSTKIPKAGTTVQGILSYNANYTDPANLVTKKTIDNFPVPQTSPNSSVVTGTVIEYGSNVTPSGYLRLNGLSVSKTTYSNLYSVIGDIYNTQNVGYGAALYNQYIFNSQTNNVNVSITHDQNNSLPNSLAWGNVVVTKNRIYYIGGADNNDNARIKNTIYTAPIDANGVIGSWSSVTPNLPYTVAGSSCVYNESYVYLVGGCTYYNNDSDNTFTNKILIATVNSDGTLSAFNQLNTTLPYNLAGHTSAIIGNYLYVFGGASTFPYSNYTGRSDVYRAVINSDGTLGSFTFVNNSPFPHVRAGSIVVGKYVYLIAGMQDLNSTGKSMARCSINPDSTLGSWEVIGSFPDSTERIVLANTRSKLYVFGGMQSHNWQTISTYNNYFYEATIDSDDNISTFTKYNYTLYVNNNTSNQVYGWISNLAITSSRLYLIGGQLASSSTISGGTFPPAQNYMFYIPFNGGTNDYIQLINSYKSNTSTFILPNYSTKEASNPGMYYYIKT